MSQAGIHLKQRQAEAWCGILGTPHRGLKNFFSFCKARHVPSILHIRRGIPRACLTLIYQHAMSQIAAASEACDSARCAVYTSRGEAAALHFGLPLPQVHSRLKEQDSFTKSCRFFCKNLHIFL